MHVHAALSVANNNPSLTPFSPRSTLYHNVNITPTQVAFPLGDYANGAAIKPDEDEMKQNPVRFGRLSDPDG